VTEERLRGGKELVMASIEDNKPVVAVKAGGGISNAAYGPARRCVRFALPASCLPEGARDL
jgi:hypothetical protein